MSDTVTNEAGLSGATGQTDHGAGGGQTARPTESRFSAWLERFATPVFVKEIRQAQRGRVFAIALVVTLTFAVFATVVAAIAIDGDNRTRAGAEFFSAVYFFLCASVLVVVPFQAFVSMGSEWDDNTFEMLVLSNLSPRQIVLGKLLSACLQGALFLAVFAPFMAVAFLLRGVDVLTLLLILALTAYACVWLSTVSIMISTLVRKRFLRVLMMVLLAGGLIMLLPASSAVAAQWIRRPDMIADAEFFIFLAQFLVATTVVGVVSFCIACNLLAHEEENRSSNLRALTTAAVLAWIGILAFNIVSPSVDFPQEGVYVTAIFGLFLLAFLASFFGFEPERLGRRVEPTVPRSPLLATLLSPWYPGGGRGVLFLLLHVGLLVGGAFGLAILLQVAGDGPRGTARYRGTSDGIFDDGGWSVIVAALYALLYTVFSMAMLHRFGTSPHRRNVMRAITIASPVLYLFVPAVVGLFLRDRDLTRMDHFGNPALRIAETWDDLDRNLDLILLVFVGAVVGSGAEFLPHGRRSRAGAHGKRREATA